MMLLFTISFAIIIGVHHVAMAQRSKPDVCNPEYTPSIKCYPAGLGDGRPPCCQAGYCKNGNYTNDDILCTSPSLCDINNDPKCYYFSGMPICCTSELACSFTSNLECDTNNYKPQAIATTTSTTTLAPITTTLHPVTATLAPITTTLAPVTTTLAPATTTLPPITTTLPPITTTLAPVTATLPPITTTLAPVTTALTLAPLTSSPTVATHEETATNNPDNTNTLAKATKLFKEKSPKADKIMSLIVDTKAVKMSVHHEVKAKTEKMFDGKAVKMSIYHDAKAKMTEKMFDGNGKAGKKHSISIHSYGAKSTKGVLEHDGMFHFRN
jgi:hypothetical protein